MNKKTLKKFFGENFKKQEKRYESYNFIENFLSKHFLDYEENKDTEKVTNLFLKELNKFSKVEIAF